MAGGCNGGAQGVKNAGVAGEGFEFLKPGAGLIGHEMLEIETNFFDGLGNFRIAGGIGVGIDFESGRGGHCGRGFVDGKRMLPLGGKVGGKIGGEV